jgi:cyclic pyranopterin phosphate synthase
MCHAIAISAIAVDFADSDGYIEGRVRVKSTGKTGVGMEALMGVSVARLTIGDMVKSAEKDVDGQYPVTRIDDIRVREKCKG